MHRVLKIFSDRSIVPADTGHVTMLYPFWGKNPEDPRDPFSGRYERYTQTGAQFFQMTSLSEADLAIFPIPWERISQMTPPAVNFIEQVRKAKKPVVVFYWSDSDADLPFDDAFVFRTSLHRSKQTARTFAMPAWSEDPLHYFGGQIDYRRYQQKPAVGFCGAAPATAQSGIMASARRALKTFVTANRANEGNQDGFLRRSALDVLSQDAAIQTNFIIRDRFLAGALNDSVMDYSILKKSRNEFFDNIRDSDYTLCARGSGNYSYRFYETLSCGRIPLFLNTDCVLPYHDRIAWNQYCVWVDKKELNQIAERVTQFHRSISESEFLQLQRDCRKLWEDYLSPEGFFRNFHRHF